MGSKSKSTSSKRATATNEAQNHAAPASKRSKISQDEIPSTISLSDHHPATANEVPFKDDDMNTAEDHSNIEKQDEQDEGESDDMDMQNDRESSEDESDVEDDEDQELRANSGSGRKKEAHTSDRIHKALTNPEIETAFHDQYMSQITQAFGDELNTLRETDSLEGPHLELLIDSLNQTGHIYSSVEKALWVAGEGQ